MKEITLLIYCIVLKILSLSANSISGIYYLDINKDITCFVDLCPDNQYNLSLFVSHTDDINEEMSISSGTYRKTSNVIILTDTIHGFTMQFQQNANKSITMKQGFVFLKDKVFSYRTKSENKSYKLFYNIKNQKQERVEYKQSHKQFYPLFIDKYESENNTIDDKEYNVYQTELGYELDIKEENRYVLYYRRILLSEGKWERDGNELALFDESLQYPFYVLITDKGLVSKYLPGDYRGLKLHRKKMKQKNVSENTFPVLIRKEGLIGYGAYMTNILYPATSTTIQKVSNILVNRWEINYSTLWETILNIYPYGPIQ